MVAGTKFEEKSEDLKKMREILCLPCSKLLDNPLHMGFYAEAHLQELVESIREVDLLEPVIVYALEKGEYRILSGHYRVKAFRRLRYKEILCRIVTCDARSSVALYCTSNLLTRSLSAMEEAYMISQLVSEEKFTLTEIGKMWGRSKSWVSRRQGLLIHLAPKIKSELGRGYLSPRVAQELLRLPRGNEQERVLAIIRKHTLNKNEVADLITRWKMAEEEEKIEIEKSFSPKSDKISAPNSSSNDLSLLVSECLSQCADNLARIIKSIGEQDTLLWWPQDTFQAFLNQVGILEGIVRKRSCASAKR
jgi:ParB family chromosome partitioning protein